MGKGDRKSKKGKRFMGSYGKKRQRKSDNSFTPADDVKTGAKKTTAKKAAPKKAAAKKTTAKKSTAKKTTAKKEDAK